MDRLIRIFIWLFEKRLSGIEKTSLTQEQSDGLLAMLWDNPSFRNYIKDRNEVLIRSIAGIAGQEVEPRDKTRLVLGQRFENLTLGAKAKAAATRRDKRLKDKSDEMKKKSETSA